MFFKLTERHKERAKREDLRFGRVAATVANTTRSKETDRVWEPVDFFPEWKAPVEPQTEEQMLFAMHAWAAATQKLAKA